MRWSQTLIPTLRQSPADAVVPSHQLMLRSGLIQQVASGSYSYLPLGWRVLHKVMNIIRQEMDRAGAVEVLLPTLQPIEWWEQTGRREAYGDNLFVVEDRHGRTQALGPTHEEVVTMLVKNTVNSYKQLPLTLYQIQTKFRDEFRPRFGVLRSREFQMKDAYSFDLTVEGLNKSYDAMFEAYRTIFKRCGLNFVTVEAESGPIGGSASHEFMVPSPTGEDTILSSDKGNYAANVEKCEIGERKWSLDGAPKGELEKVHTPGCASIEDVGKFMKVKPKNMLKTLIFVNPASADSHDFTNLIARRQEEETSLHRAKFEAKADKDAHAQDPRHVELDRTGAGRIAECERRLDEVDVETRGFFDKIKWAVVIVRGDHDVNEAKVAAAAGMTVVLADNEIARRAGFPIGYVGPNVLQQLRSAIRANVRMFVDYDAAQEQFWATGANEQDHHVKYFNWNRDVFENRNFEIRRPSTPNNPDPKGIVLQFKDEVVIADVRNAVDGDPSPKNDGGVLRMAKGIEIGHVFKLGTKYTDALDVKVLDQEQKPRPVIMGCYGIGVNRIIASALEAEAGHDEKGIIWPKSIAPYQVVVTPVRYEGAVKDATDKLYAELRTAGLDVLLDDRDERPGVKFNDADLIGIPLRITIGDKALATGDVEYKPRTAAEAEKVKLADVVAKAVGFFQ